MSYDVATSVYDGPFDLLLHLILKDEVDLYEVSLTTIVDALSRRSSGSRSSTWSRPLSSS